MTAMGGAGDPRRAIPAEDRIADALADLSDTLSAFRVLFEAESERYAKERADDEEHQHRKDPVRREASLRELRDTMRGVIHEAVGGPITVPPEMEHELADRIVTIIEKRTRTSYGLREALRILGNHQPPEDLTEIAQRRAVADLGTNANPDDINEWVKVWLGGALYHERG